METGIINAFEVGELVTHKVLGEELTVIKSMEVPMWSGDNNLFCYMCEYKDGKREIFESTGLERIQVEVKNDLPSTELTNGKRTNIISRVSCSDKETIIKFEIENNMIKFDISKNPITLQGLLKILLNEINIKTYKYDRISPYTTHHEFTDKRHKFFISYFDLREFGNFNKKYISTDEVLTTNSNMLVEIGEYEIFIPNLIEVARFKNLIINNGNGEEIKALNNEMNRSKYLNISKEMYINDMQKLGFKVPDRFKKAIDSFDYECLDLMIGDMKNI